MINKFDCKKVLSMLSLFIEHKLDDETSFFIETHLLKCGECYKKYLEMKEIMTNLHFEYEKIMDELMQKDSDKNYREYDTFYNNISPYIDNELSYEDSIKFRKYLLSSKPARKELASAYGLKNYIKQSVSKFTNSLNINYSKKIIKKLKEENNDTFSLMYKRALTAITIMIALLIIISYAGLSYINKNYAHAKHNNNVKTETKTEYIFPNEDDLVEFTFDENNEALLTAK